MVQTSVWRAVAMGMLGAIPCLLSTWCALDELAAILRIPLSMGMLTILTLLYTKLLIGTRPALDETLVLTGIVLVTSLVIQIPLWSLRLWTRHVIALPEPKSSEAGPSQFGISQLLLATTVMALVFAGAKTYFSEVTSESSFSDPWVLWAPVIILYLFFILVVSLIAMVTLAVVFGRARRRTYARLLLFLMFAAPIGTLFFMDQWSRIHNIFGPDLWTTTAIINSCFAYWALAITNFLVLHLFYAIGYRLTKRT